MNDSEVLELVNFFPEDAGWVQQMYRRELGGQYGTKPQPRWCQWAGEFLLASSTNDDGVDVLVRLLALAEALYPGGMERARLEESLAYLFEKMPRLSQYPSGTLNYAVQQRLVREDRVDLWVPGMAPGRGWCTYYRLTLAGKSKVNMSEMPPKDAPPPPPPPKLVPVTIQREHAPWWRRVESSTAQGKQLEKKMTTLPKDFIWQKPYVEQQVGYFFRRNAKLYMAMALDVLNAKKELTEFSAEFGPAKISQWINEKHNVQPDHPNPCKPQNINNSATYEACVKSFKRNPDNHKIAQIRYQAESPQVANILQELFGSEVPLE